MKTVLIVGAGPAGLVAAKTLLKRVGNPFRITVFEAAERVGGMWRAKKDEYGDRCSPSMRTNLSRFTVAFADLSWHDVDLGPEDSHSKPGSPPMFPRAYQVGQYLEEYAKRFIPNGVISFNREVKHAKLNNEQPRKWIISSLDKTSQITHEDEFDYLIIASGFFDQPKNNVPVNNRSLLNEWLREQESVAWNDTSTEVIENFGRKLQLGRHPALKKQHSSRFRDLSSLSSNPGKIVVIGGGISGSEAAATAAFQISNAKHCPGQSKPSWADCEVYHLFQRPFYCLSRYLPQDPYNSAIQGFNLSPQFLPLDLVLYNLSRRGSETITASIGCVPPDKAKKGHDFIRSVIGGDQRNLGHSELVSKPWHTEFAPYTGISDYYAEFVRSGLIKPVYGRAKNIATDQGQNAVEYIQNGPWMPSTEVQGTIDQVAGIIEATGFYVQLNYLSTEVKTALEYDPQCHRIPFLLSRGSIMNDSVPEIAFVGFYEGPYWGVMEMQAHIIADRWNQQPNTKTAIPTSLEEAKKTREDLRRRLHLLPQFWMMDYVGLVEEFSRLVGISRNDDMFLERQSGPAFPARYAGPGSNVEAANSVFEEVHNVLQASQNVGRFVAAAAFRAMQGTWDLARKVDSRHPSSPGGTLKGTAHFHPREPTAPSVSAEYLYMEEGTFTMDNGFSFPATRRYVYRYSEIEDQICTYFVQEDGVSAEKLFNKLVFERPDSDKKGWIAKSSHWCDPDKYNSDCEFRFRGASLESFGITYKVSGPKKDYTHESWYHRSAPGQ